MLKSPCAALMRHATHIAFPALLGKQMSASVTTRDKMQRNESKRQRDETGGRFVIGSSRLNDVAAADMPKAFQRYSRSVERQRHHRILIRRIDHPGQGWQPLQALMTPDDPRRFAAGASIERVRSARGVRRYVSKSYMGKDDDLGMLSSVPSSRAGAGSVSRLKRFPFLGFGGSMASANCHRMASTGVAFSAIVARVLAMTISLSAHFDGKSIVLDEDYPLRPQAKLLVTVIEDESTIDARAERSAWSALGKPAFARVFGSDEPDYSVADAVP